MDPQLLDPCTEKLLYIVGMSYCLSGDNVFSESEQSYASKPKLLEESQPK